MTHFTKGRDAGADADAGAGADVALLSIHSSSGCTLRLFSCAFGADWMEIEGDLGPEEPDPEPERVEETA